YCPSTGDRCTDGCPADFSTSVTTDYHESDGVAATFPTSNSLSSTADRKTAVSRPTRNGADTSDPDLPRPAIREPSGAGATEYSTRRGESAACSASGAGPTAFPAGDTGADVYVSV